MPTLPTPLMADTQRGLLCAVILYLVIGVFFYTVTGLGLPTYLRGEARREFGTSPLEISAAVAAWVIAVVLWPIAIVVRTVRAVHRRRRRRLCSQRRVAVDR